MEETAKQRAGRLGGLRRAENRAKGIPPKPKKKQAKQRVTEEDSLTYNEAFEQAGQDSGTDDGDDGDSLKGTPNQSSTRGQSIASEASGQSKKRSNPAQAKGPSKKKSKLAKTESVSTSMLGEAESTEEVVPQRTAPAMPTMLFKLLGENAHACRCTICEPDFRKKLLAQATEFLRAQEIKHLEDEVAKELRVQVLQDLRLAAYEQAKRDVNEAALKELTDEKAKDEKRKMRDEALAAARKELEPKLREELTPLIKQEILKQLA